MGPPLHNGRRIGLERQRTTDGTPAHVVVKQVDVFLRSDIEWRAILSDELSRPRSLVGTGRHALVADRSDVALGSGAATRPSEFGGDGVDAPQVCEFFRL
jgi:hypothetical protein